jgi:RHS repeat-associated protein
MPTPNPKYRPHYYPFGSSLNTRSFSAGSAFRFGFCGHQKEDKVLSGWYEFEGYGLDTRLSRRPSPDPLADKYADISPYSYCFNNPVSVLDIDGKEGIVISGQPGDHKGREHFLANGLDRAKQLSKQFKKENKGEKVTWFIYNSGGAGGFDQKTLTKYQEKAAKAGVTIQVVDDADKIVEYVNEKTGGGSRAADQVSNLYYFGHATLGDLDIGFVNHGVWNMMTNDKIEPSSFTAEAFGSGANINVVGGCRTALSGDLPSEKSVIDQFADKIDSNSTVKGSDVRVYYPGGVVSDQQLVAPNKGTIVEIKGRGATN